MTASSFADFFFKNSFYHVAGGSNVIDRADFEMLPNVRAYFDSMSSNRSLLSADAYKDITDSTVVVCVDTIIYDIGRGRYFLVMRKHNPLRGLPRFLGSRMWKGEGYMDTATRKIRETLLASRTGQSKAVFRCRVVGPSSTHFRSPHDPHLEIQTMNVVVYCETGGAQVTVRDGIDHVWLSAVDVITTPLFRERSGYFRTFFDTSLRFMDEIHADRDKQRVDL